MGVAISEAAFQKQVEQVLDLRGWLFVHHRNSIGTRPGFPDIFALRRERAVALELKVGKNKPTLAQRVWYEAMKAAGIEAHIVYPEDFDTIMEVLK